MSEAEPVAEPLRRRLGRGLERGLTRGIRRAPRQRPEPFEPGGSPVLSVVVPFHDPGPRLRTCVDSLLAQTLDGIEVLLVDDGSTDDSPTIAEGLAEAHTSVRVLHQPHQGTGAARDTGVATARGEFLAFCDADDVVVADGYQRLVGALRSSGSDLAIGSVTVQTKGRHLEPVWARRSNETRRLGTRPESSPAIMTHLVLGARLFRASFWREHAFTFAGAGVGSDVVTVVETMLRARSLDILPAVVYRWCRREDGRSLLQRSLVDADVMAERVARFADAGELLEGSPEHVRRSFFAGVLHTTVPDLVRSAVTRDPPYWDALGEGLRRFLELATVDVLAEVHAEDRLLAWLCARGHREAAEHLLEYAFDNPFGYPYRADEPRPIITLPFLDVLAETSEDLARVAPADMRYRTRLTALGWVTATRLRVEGGAFLHYADDRLGPSTVTLVLRERTTGEEVRVATRPEGRAAVDSWAARAHEEHAGGGFAGEIEVDELPRRPGGNATFDVLVDLVVGPHHRTAPFRARTTSGSAGLLEPRTSGDRLVVPRWRSHAGLELTVRPPRRGRAGVSTAGPTSASPAVVTQVEPGDRTVVLRGSAAEGVPLRLVGPRTGTRWCPMSGTADDFTVHLPLELDEWGTGPTWLPDDLYAVRALVGGREEPVGVDAELWRGLPADITVGAVAVEPKVSAEGALELLVVPVDRRASAGPLARQRLRDRDYPQARSRPLRDLVLFETFAGKAGGDNPGALCRELSSRGTGMDLVCSVVDLSIPLPEGARPVIRFSAEYVEALARARWLIVNAALPYWFRKRPDQLCLQTWHGSPLKRIAHDRPHQDFLNWHHRRQLLTARDGWDQLLSQSPFCTQSLRSAFRYDGPVLESGYPRNDLLLSPSAETVRLRTRRALGLTEDERVVLYAPTWRDNVRIGRVFQKVLYLDPHRVVEELPGTVVLVRGHYNSVKAAEHDDPDRRVIDVTRYPDVADLYLAADALVTDYSSVFFDFVLTDKPMVFLAPDLVEYRDENRGFYLDYHEVVPGPVCLTTEEVVAALAAGDGWAERRAAFRREFTPLDDGGASARVIDALLGDATGR